MSLTTLNLLSSLLAHRSQTVTITPSKPYSVLMDVVHPRYSVLGILLYSLYTTLLLSIIS